MSTAVLCSVLFLLACADICSTACTEQEVEEYLMAALTPECVDSLTALQMRLSPPDATSGAAEPLNFVPAISNLDTVCDGSCGGAYAVWLRDQCQDPFTARMLEATCVFTFGTASVVPRCRSAFPDAIGDLRGRFQDIFTCGLGSSPDTCPLLPVNLR
jgi:hypothetical protein